MLFLRIIGNSPVLFILNRIAKYIFIVILMENDLLTFYKKDVQLMFYLTKEMEGKQ